MLNMEGQVGVAGICQRLQQLSAQPRREGAGGRQKKTGMARSHPGELKVRLRGCRFLDSRRGIGIAGGCLLGLVDHATDTGSGLSHYIVIEVGVAG